MRSEEGLNRFDLSFCKLLFFFMNGKRYTLSGQRTADEYSLSIDSGNTPALIIQRKNFRLLIPFFHTHTVSVRQPLTGRLTVFQYRKRIFSHKTQEFQVSCAKNFHYNPYKKDDMKKLFLGLTAALLTSAAAANTLIPDVSPASSGQHVVINITQQRLFLYDNGKLSKIYPVAVGKAMTQTNLGEHKIGAKAYNPVWHIPKSIQKERNDGVKSVPAGPNNPLGPVFVRLGDPKLSLGIHGTQFPCQRTRRPQPWLPCA